MKIFFFNYEWFDPRIDVGTRVHWFILYLYDPCILIWRYVLYEDI